jgi:hypothetical protein
MTTHAMRIEQYTLVDEAGESYVGFRGVANRAGTEAHFARQFVRDPALSPGHDMHLRPLGEFHLVATRAGVTVRRASVRTVEQLEALVAALDEAHAAYHRLCYHRHPLEDPNANPDLEVESLALEDEADQAMRDLREE